jgi:PAS domain S-box-containing protein
MAAPTPRPRSRVLLLCEDPVLVQLLRGLLRALPEPWPEAVVPEHIPDDIPLAAPGCTVCFLEPGAGGVGVQRLLARLRAVAPGLRVVGILGESSRHGDRAEVMQWLKDGLGDLLIARDLSANTLAALLDAPSQAPLAALPQGDASTSAASSRRPGSWRIALVEQRASFDAATLERLGFGPGDIGNTIGDWKSLLHPADLDVLVSAVQSALDGIPMAGLSYRLRRRTGGWIEARSTGITVAADTSGAPVTVTGHFVDADAGADASAEPRQARVTPEPEAVQPSLQTPRAAHEPPPIDAAMQAASTHTDPATLAPATTDASALASHAQTAMLLCSPDASGVFRVLWRNDAASAQSDSTGHGSSGKAADVLPACDNFRLEDALARVHGTGIPEQHDALLLARADPPAWRRFQLCRLPDGDVLVEVQDISELVRSQSARRSQDELTGAIVRSLPVTTLLVDESGIIEHCISSAGGVLAEAAPGIEGRALAALLGVRAGDDCLHQVTRTLNTSRPGLVTVELDTSNGHHWIECRSTLLRGRPGALPRVVLALIDVTARVQESREARASSSQFRAALRSLPVPLYLKDIEGRYAALNGAFERLLGVEETMLLGKTDVEVFPDDVATELHDNERRLQASVQGFAEIRTVGVGAARTQRWCFEFPVRANDGTLQGWGGLWLSASELPSGAVSPASTPEPETARSQRHRDLESAAASVINRVEDALTDSGDYADVLRQLEQLVETTMQAQALIHQVAGHGEAASTRPLVALAPLAQDIMELERILLPASAHFQNEIEPGLPPAHCEPVAFHQILLRGIRHARRALGPEGTLCIRLRRASGARRACLSCREGFEGAFVELVIEDSDSRLGDEDLALLTTPGVPRPVGSGIDDLAEVLALCHTQGGHLQVHRLVPGGLSLHVFFRAGDAASLDGAGARARSTVTPFPFGRSQQRGGQAD